MKKTLGTLGYLFLVISAVFLDAPIIALLAMPIFLVGFVCLISSSAIAQERINLSAGFGQTELLNAGIRGQISQIQIALSFGTFFMGEVAISGDAFYHFAGNSNYTERRPWYFRTGISYIHIKEDYPMFKLFSFGLWKNEPVNITDLNLRIGRDFNISDNIGFNADVGLAILLNADVGQAHAGSGEVISGAFSVSIFYRLIKK